MNDQREWMSLTPGRTAVHPLTERVCTNIRRIRELRGMSQAELGEKLGISRSVVSKAERGDHAPTVARLNDYALALGVHAAFLLLADPESAMLVDSGQTFFFDGKR